MSVAFSKKISFLCLLSFLLCFLSVPSLFSAVQDDRCSNCNDQVGQNAQNDFNWWPSDAKPEPVKDKEKGGYWWYPAAPGTTRPWGNRGYIYVNKVIFDYKSEELPSPQPKELRPSLLIKRIIKNVKVYFDLDGSTLRRDALQTLESAVRALDKNPESTILITGNCDRRGPESYNEKLGRRRAEAVKAYMVEHGIPEERIRIISRGKLDAIAPITDLEGMQKDRNAQFMVALVEEVMIPYDGEVPESAEKIEEGKFIAEENESVETQVRVSMQEYTVRKGDSLWSIAKKEYGKPYRWKYLYEINKDKIKNPNKLRPGTVLMIPVE